MSRVNTEMRIGARARTSSLVVATLAMATLVVPVIAAEHHRRPPSAEHSQGRARAAGVGHRSNGPGDPGLVISGAKPSPKPTPRGGPTPVPTATPVPTPSPTPTPTPTPTPPRVVQPAPQSTPRGGTRTTAATARPTVPVGAIEEGSGGPYAAPSEAAPGAAGEGRDSGGLIAELSPEAIGIIALVVVLLGAGMAFLIATRRRRPKQEPARLSAVSGTPRPTLHLATASGRAIAVDDDVALPRWIRNRSLDESEERARLEPRPRTSRRRPVLFTDPLGESSMRLVVRYDGVALLSQPNEAYADVLTEMGTGDEVEILDIDEPWARVLTPRGIEGWLPTMTIGAAPDD